MRHKLLTAILLSWFAVAVLHAVTFVNDTMTDDTLTTILDHPPDTGGTWTNHAVCFSALQISDHNDLTHVTPDNGCTVYNDTNPSSNEYSVSADIVYHSGDISLAQFGVGGRLIEGQQTGYFVVWSGFETGWTLFKAESGSFSGLGTFGQALSAGNSYNVRLEITDEAKTVYIDDVERITSADNTITGTGHGGIDGYRETGSDINALHIDNFVVEDNPTPPAGGVKPKRLLLLGVGGK